MNADNSFVSNLRSSAFIGGESLFRNLLGLDFSIPAKSDLMRKTGHYRHHGSGSF